MPRLRPPARRTARVALAALATGAVLAAAYVAVRDSSLVAVERVTITGADGRDAAKVRAALRRAALDMTTLDVREDALRRAVRPFPSVAGLRIDARLPHGLRIEVREHVAVAAVANATRRVAIAADGTALPAMPTAGLPEVAAKSSPADAVAEEPAVRRAVGALAAAPAPLRAVVRRLYSGPQGLTAVLRDGPLLVLGDSNRLHAKWAAATAVLADPTSAGATYVDVRMPERPAAGGLEPVVDPQAAGAAAPGPT